ncbi:MAG: hypothetical protein LBG27_01700 [Spirochaetaceae bacterium]|jgi:hypothetical protein|nr:hypothetical protein [Spirochaetaceae bacterium]
MSDDKSFPWKQEALRALIMAVITSAVTSALNAVYRIRFAELGSVIDSMPVPLLLLVTGIFVVLSFVLRLTRLEQRIMRVITDCMLIAGLAVLSIAMVAALNIGTVPLKSFELTEDNVYDSREVAVPRNLENITLKVSGDRDPGFPLELERRGAGNGTIEQLAIEGLEADNAIRHGRYYTLVRGQFTVPGPLKAGDTLYLHFANAPSLGGKIKLELTGSKDKE